MRNVGLKRRNRLRQRQPWWPKWRPWVVIGSQFSAGIMLAVALIALVLSLSRLDPSALKPLERIEVAGDLRQIQPQSILQIARSGTSGFFASDIQEIRMALESEPWIEHATVRRIWPDRLEITVRERIPVARWNESFLVDRWGQVFGPVESARWVHLPHLEGEPGRQVPMMHRYLEVAALLADLGVEVDGLQETARLAWQVSLADGSRILMGRDDDVSRLNQLHVLLPVLGSYQESPLAKIDLRYSRGAAVTWQLADSGVPQAGGRR
jgi:cell division protein FtsQ